MFLIINFAVLVFLAGIFDYTSSTDCPDKWVAFQGKCYFFPYGTAMTFYEAEHYCRQHHESHLVHVENALENAFIKDILTGQRAEPHWLGLTDELVESVWKWYDTDMTLTYSDWFPSQPGSDGGDQDCAVFWNFNNYAYQWGDIQCLYKSQPICQIKVNQEVIVG